MNKSSKLSMVLGAAFLMFSGLFYTLERLTSYIYWQTQVSTGSYPTEPEMLPFFSNLFVPLFLVLGIGLIIWSFVLNEEERKERNYDGVTHGEIE